jgi:hypothetical protein
MRVLYDVDLKAYADSASLPQPDFRVVTNGGATFAVSGGAGVFTATSATNYSSYAYAKLRTQVEDNYEILVQYKLVNIGAGAFASLYFRSSDFNAVNSSPDWCYNAGFPVATSSYGYSKRANASTVTLAPKQDGALSRTPVNGDIISYRLRVEGDLFRSKAWFEGTTEPSTWGAYAMDPGQVGRGGMYLSFSGGTFGAAVIELRRVVVADLTTDREGAITESQSLVHIGRTETIHGVKTFSQPPTMPTPTATGHAATKAYVDGLALTRTVNVVAASGAAQTIPAPTTALMHKYTLTANCTFTLPTAVAGQSFLVSLVQDGTGSRTATFTGAKWPGGTAPTLSTGAGKIDDLAFVCTDATTGWKGQVVGLDMR